MRKLPFVIVALVVSITAQLAAQTQSEMTEEARRVFEEADAELKLVYNKILEVYADDTEFIDNLHASQRAWFTFRDAHLRAMFPRRKGSVTPMCRYYAKAELTDRRTAQLRAWLEGEEEGNVCAGSVKHKHELEEVK